MTQIGKIRKYYWIAVFSSILLCLASYIFSKYVPYEVEVGSQIEFVVFSVCVLFTLSTPFLLRLPYGFFCFVLTLIVSLTIFAACLFSNTSLELCALIDMLFLVFHYPKEHVGQQNNCTDDIVIDKETDK